MRRVAKVLSILAGLFFVGIVLRACSQDAAVTESPPLDPVVVYAAYEDKTYLPVLFNEFTQETGIIVIVRNGEVPAIVDEVIGKSASPPADVLISPSVYGVWRVSEEGELRPNYSEVIETSVPGWLRDPDKYWLALSYRKAVIAYDPAQIQPAQLSAYEDLSAEMFRRKLCLSSSELAINRAVIAMLIQKLGKRNAELAVRSWVANLAQPPFDTEASLLNAIASGECAVGIVSSSAAATADLEMYSPAETYVEIEAAGVTRHARNPDAAIALLDWMLGAEIQQRHAAQTSSLSVLTDAQSSHNVVLAAAGHFEAAQLAERARYR